MQINVYLLRNKISFYVKIRKKMDRFNFKNYDTDVRFVSVIESKGLEYPEAPKGGREMTAVDGYIHAELMVPETAMVVPEMFMGFEPIVTEEVPSDEPTDEPSDEPTDEPTDESGNDEGVE